MAGDDRHGLQEPIIMGDLRRRRARGHLEVESLEMRGMLAGCVHDPGLELPTALVTTEAAANATQHWQQSDRVSWWNSQDSYRFNLATTKHLELDVSGQSAPVQVGLTDSLGRALFKGLASDKSGSLWTGDLAAGTYTITISAWTWATTNYTVKLDVGAIGNTPPPVTTTPVTSPPTATTPAPVTNPQVFPDVAYFGGTNDWNLNAINAPESWSQGYRGQGTIVAVVDTGIDWTHVDLRESIWTNVDEVVGDGIDNDHNGYVDDIHGWDFVNSDANPMDQNGHGTHVAGTIAAARNDVGVTGIAYQAHVMPVRVLGADGSGSDYAVAQGIRYAVDNGADIINLSLGSSGYSSSLYSALSYAASKDVLIVAASGNEAAAAPSYPARFSNQWTNVVSVGAFDRSGAAAYFSNAIGNVGAVQVAAPGVDIYSTLPGGRYGSMSGTSMAAPQVAGLAALILSANPQLSATQVRQMITAGASKGVSGGRAVGSGVNAAISVAQARLATATTANSGAKSNKLGAATTLASAAARPAALPDSESVTSRRRLNSAAHLHSEQGHRDQGHWQQGHWQQDNPNQVPLDALGSIVDRIYATSQDREWIL